MAARSATSPGWLPRLWAVSLLISIAIFAAALFGEDGVRRHEALRDNIQALNQQNRALKEENEQLHRRVRALSSDESYIQQTIRDRLGWVRENELLFVPEKKR